MLSLTAGENGAIIIKNGTRVKITNRIFLSSSCFGGSVFQRVHLWMAGMVYERNLSPRRGNNQKNELRRREEDSHKNATKS